MSGRLLTARADVEAVLRACRTAVVLGAHPERFRAAFYVPEYMHQQGMRVIGVNPTKAGQVLWGEPVRAHLAHVLPEDVPDGIDVLDVFRRSGDVPAHVPEILAMPVRPRCVWLQLGIRNDAAAAGLVDAGIDVVQDRCILADHRAWGLPSVAR